jgi:hypothetical protein
MKVLIEEDVFSQKDGVDGVEFDIRDDSVFITIGHCYVKVDKEDLIKIMKLLS